MPAPRGSWIQVTSADELRAAALVELRPCGFCGKTERFILLHRTTPADGASLTAEGDFREPGACWVIAPGLCLHRGRPFDPSAAIASGRLWRRADVIEHDETEAGAQKTREPALLDRGP